LWWRYVEAEEAAATLRQPLLDVGDELRSRWRDDQQYSVHAAGRNRLLEHRGVLKDGDNVDSGEPYWESGSDIICVDFNDGDFEMSELPEEGDILLMRS